MRKVKIGLITAPGFSSQFTKNIIEILKIKLKESVSNNVNWEIYMEKNSVIGSAEHVNQCVDLSNNIKKENQWNYATCITDLPSISNHKVVISDFSSQNKTGLISLPSLGVFNLKNKLCESLNYMIYAFYFSQEITDNKNIKYYNSHLKQKVSKVVPSEKTSANNRYIYKYTLIGFIYLIMGMVMANRPWKAVFAFKKILSLGFATGTYISIFSTPWQLSIEFSFMRFILLMIISIGGIILWLIYAHNLWEKASSKSQKQYRYLYNTTTFITLLNINVINYIFLFLLLSLSSYFFVPDSLFDSMAKPNTHNDIQNFLRLSWFTTSVGLIAGAFGSTIENKEVVQEMTYSSRQSQRTQEVNKQYKQEEEFSKKSTREEKHEGEEQSHKEGS